MRRLDRRDFLRISGSASGLLALAALDGDAFGKDKPDAANGKAGDVNSQLRVAVVGVNGRGMSHVGAFSNNKQLNTVITHVCDADTAVIGKAMTKIEKDQGKAPIYVQDFRKLLADLQLRLARLSWPAQ